MGADGVLIQQFNGAAAGQTVFHLHFHILPVKEGRPLKPHAGQMVDQASPRRHRREDPEKKLNEGDLGLTAIVMRGFMPGSPRLHCMPASKTWMAGTSPGHDESRADRSSTI